MGNAHQMVIDDIGKVIGWISIGFNEDHIVQLRVIYADISINIIMESGGSFRRVILADNIWNTRCQFFLDLFFGKMETMLIINHDLLTGHFLFQVFQTFFVAETIIGFTLID